MSGLAEKLWSRCASCQKCEWNHKLATSGRICSGCGDKVNLCTPKKKKKVSFNNEDEDFFDAHSGDEGGVGGESRNRSTSPGGKGGKGGRGGSQHVRALLQQAATAAAADPELKAVLEGKVAQLTAKMEQESVTRETPGEALKRSEGAVRNAEHLHEQAVGSVLRLRSKLAAAETKEKEAAKTLAEALAAKKSSTLAMARAEGLSALPAAEVEAKRDNLFTIEWDEKFFSRPREHGVHSGREGPSDKHTEAAGRSS